MKTKKIAHLPVTIERNGDGFLVNCPLIQGAFAEGDTIEDAISKYEVRIHSGRRDGLD